MTIAVKILGAIHKFCIADFSTCTDDLPTAQCLTLKNNHECIFDKAVNGTSCLCHETCISSNLCPAADGPLLDSRCDCIHYLDQCGGYTTPKPGCPLAAWKTDCFRTAYFYDISLSCINNIQSCSHTVGIPGLQHGGAFRYGDIEQYWCADGYKQIGGSIGLSICWEGNYIQHGDSGEYPVCELITCSDPPKVLYTNPSATQVSVFDDITYTCQDGTEQIDGGDGRIKCGTDGLWHPCNTTINPICIGDFAFFVKLPTFSPSVLLITYQSRSSIECASLCLNLYMCVGYTFDSSSSICSLNESGDQDDNTQMIQVYPY
ncbi:hypothetical protein LOTGIDRAFT_153318 [Lottia gigantea]|uniref:Sushi domain-containing protein n=1 Tax=Lottia gigantea TaxID=225164 RepID=V4AFG6_LOTGI|nr:hypothetical protein LOTGIDRAFT_153318 [Lottia gigantea]ESO93845.1 hypothetical protein LOTGIDRAFT_153318 [Lottia gigantea]